MKRTASHVLAGLLLACLLCLISARAAQAGDPPAPPARFITLATRSGVSLPLGIIDVPQPKAVLILLPGGSGRIGLVSRPDGTADVTMGGNFLVRSRGLFIARGLAVVLVDVPSDHAEGLGATFRVSQRHLEDVRAVVAYVRERFGMRPWLAGTSLGCISTGSAAGRLDDALAGVVLGSCVTRCAPDWELRHTHPNATLDTGLERFHGPALVLRNTTDACLRSPPEDGPRVLESLAGTKRKALFTFQGTELGRGNPCDGRTAHGYLGIENEAAQAIADFILAQPPAAD